MLDLVAAKLTCCLFCRFSYRWCCAAQRGEAIFKGIVGSAICDRPVARRLVHCDAAQSPRPLGAGSAQHTRRHYQEDGMFKSLAGASNCGNRHAARSLT